MSDPSKAAKNSPEEGASGRLLVLGILAMALLLASLAVYLRRHGGPTFALAKLAGQGVDPNEVAVRQHEVAVGLDRAREALLELRSTGASFEAALELIDKETRVFGGSGFGFSLAPREGRPWALFGAVQGSFPVRVGIGDEEPTRAERALVLILNELRIKKVEWPLAVAAFGPALMALKIMEPGDADLDHIGYKVSDKEPWILTITTSDRRARVEVLPPKERQARLDLQDAVRIELDRLRKSGMTWGDALQPIATALEAERFLEPYRYQVTDRVAWRVAALIPPRGEFNVIAPTLPAPIATPVPLPEGLTGEAAE